VPRLWSSTIDQHRHEVRSAVLDAAAELAARNGVLAVTMTQIAETVGIGRATLYKYYPDVAAIYADWHDQQVTRHVEHIRREIAAVRSPKKRLVKALETHVERLHEQHRSELAQLHLSVFESTNGASAHTANTKLVELLEELIAELVVKNQPSDRTAHELALFANHALGAANELTTQQARRRLVHTIATAIDNTHT
jgi:AcrR family transcriptional regulator